MQCYSTRWTRYQHIRHEAYGHMNLLAGAECQCERSTSTRLCGTCMVVSWQCIAASARQHHNPTACLRCHKCNVLARSPGPLKHSVQAQHPELLRSMPLSCLGRHGKDIYTGSWSSVRWYMLRIHGAGSSEGRLDYEVLTNVIKFGVTRSISRL